MEETLKHLKTDPNLLHQYQKDSVYQGAPQYVYRAQDWQITREVLEYCYHHKMPVTFCGSQTSMTGSSVADNGVALALGSKAKILDIGEDKNGQPFVVTEPGVLLGDLKEAVAQEGYFYPPDPTSYKEAQIGSSVATNATGSDTFKYGPTRRYVQELEIIKADGQSEVLTRTNPVPHSILKNTAGYYMNGEPIDEIIGSEGTLALITKLKLKLLKLSKDKTFLLILPFSDFKKCMQAVGAIIESGYQPRALELIGPGATDYFQRCAACPEELKKEKSFLYIKDEYVDESDLQKTVEDWFACLQQVYQKVDDTACLQRVFLAQTDQQLKDIQECRHYIPLKVNEEYFEFISQGGGKVGTDWWVPVAKVPEMMNQVYQEACELGIPFLVFAHIGNGHPHWNFLTRHSDEHAQAIAFVKRQCARAVELGGGVAGEHGIGKIKQYLIDIQLSAQEIKAMQILKRRWDPRWILGRGNILKVP